MLLFTIPYGSSVYGLTNPKSDKDLVSIYSDLNYVQSEEENSYSFKEFNRLLQLHDLMALECYFYSKDVQEAFDFELNLHQLRKAVSAVVSNSHVKAKKKFKDEEIYIGLKSYFHCIRNLTMYTYLARHGTFDPSSFKNELEYVYQDIVVQRQLQANSETLFKELETDYKKLLKSLQHCFRMYCPKV